MKRTGNLKHLWCNYEALLKAFYEVKKNKSYHHNVMAFEMDLVTNLNRILADLENDSYKVKPPRVFYVWEPKKRLIEAPHIEDRIVQHALVNACGSLIDRRFIDTTFACRKGKGTHQASDTLKRYLHKFGGGGYYLKMDITKFFYNIDHKILMDQLSTIIKCEQTLKIIYKFFQNETGKGLPLGSVTSQILANLALNPIDHLIKRGRKHKYYLRYMDDLLILDADKNKLIKTLEICKVEIEKLGLTLNNKTTIGKIPEGIDFVGYKTYPNYRLIRKRSLFTIKRKLKKHNDVNRISSFLSHAKKTVSISYVISKILEVQPVRKEFVKTWIYKNLKGKRNELLQIQCCY